MSDENKLSSLSLFDAEPPSRSTAPPKKEEKEEEKEPTKSLVPTDDEVEEKGRKKPKEQNKQSKDKDTQFSELRAKKDSLEKEVEELRKKLEENSGGYKPSDDIADYFKPFESEEDPVAALARAHGSTREDNEKLKKQLKEQQEQLRELGIEHDPDFAQKYVAPFEQAQDNLKVELFKIDEKGEYVHPEHFSSLYSTLIKGVEQNDGKVDARIVKATISSFKKKYEEETGEEWEAPRNQDVVDGLRNIVGTFNSLREGRENYEEEKAKIKEESELARIRQTKERNAQQKGLREAQSKEFIDSYEFDKHTDLGSEQDIRARYEKAFKKAESFYEDPSTVPTFPEMVRNFMHLELFEEMRKENVELKEKLKELGEDGLGSGSEGKGVKTKENKPQSAIALFE